MKRAFLVMVCAAAMALGTSCTTLENRADLYSPRNYFANGPYTRMLADRNSQGDDGLRSNNGDQDHRADFFSPLRKIIAAEVYSTVTLLARFRGLSTSQPSSTAM